MVQLLEPRLSKQSPAFCVGFACSPCFFSYSGFLPQSKEMHIRLKGNSSLSVCLSVFALPLVAIYLG